MSSVRTRRTTSTPECCVVTKSGEEAKALTTCSLVGGSGRHAEGRRVLELQPRWTFLVEVSDVRGGYNPAPYRSGDVSRDEGMRRKLVRLRCARMCKGEAARLLTRRLNHAPHEPGPPRDMMPEATAVALPNRKMDPANRNYSGGGLRSSHQHQVC